MTFDQNSQHPNFEAQQLERVNGLMTKIKERVSDRTLRDSPCARVAWAIVEGTLPPAELGRILDRIDQLRATLNSPGAYFIAAAKKQFEQRGIPWS